MGIEPTLFHLASGRFTTKLHPHVAVAPYGFRPTLLDFKLGRTAPFQNLTIRF